jgi:hypothetical protein
MAYSQIDEYKLFGSFQLCLIEGRKEKGETSKLSLLEAPQEFSSRISFYFKFMD